MGRPHGRKPNRAFSGHATTIHAVPVPGHDHHAPDALVATARASGFTATTARDPQSALGWMAATPTAPPLPWC